MVFSSKLSVKIRQVNPSQSKEADVFSSSDLNPKKSEETLLSQLNLDKFTLFPKLPIELRNMIWQLALSKPRIVSVFAKPRFYASEKEMRKEIQYVQANYAITHIDNQSDLSHLCSKPVRVTKRTPETTQYATSSSISIKHPILLRTCKESRCLAKKNYKLVFRLGLNLKPIFIDPSRDILYFDGVPALLMFLGLQFAYAVLHNMDLAAIPQLLPQSKHLIEKKLKNIVVDSCLSHPLLDILPRFEKLENIMLLGCFPSSEPFHGPVGDWLLEEDVGDSTETRAENLMTNWRQAAQVDGYNFKEPTMGHGQGHLFWNGDSRVKDFNEFCVAYDGSGSE